MTVTTIFQYGQPWVKKTEYEKVVVERDQAIRQIREGSSVPKGAPLSETRKTLAFQNRVLDWVSACFPDREGIMDPKERNLRFLEEALELVQAGGLDRKDVEAMTAHVFDRPGGELSQEVGGVMVCLAALCAAHRLDMMAEAETELARVWTKIDRIREKQAEKISILRNRSASSPGDPQP